MELNDNCGLAIELAERIRSARVEITQHWFDRIAARVSIDDNQVFPSEDLLDQVPVLIDGIADYIGNPAEEIVGDTPVVAKAMELGALRLAQGFGAHEILKEYEILGGILFNFAAREAERLEAQCSPAELIIFGHRLFRAISFVEQVTASQYLRDLGDQVKKREEQLRRFNRMVSHELKNKVGAVLGAGELINEEWLSAEDRDKFTRIVIGNAQALQLILDNLISLSKLDTDSRRQRNVRLPESASEVFRQLRDFARSREVELKLGELPRVEVNAAAVELCLSNYLSNAIKYSDPRKTERWVTVAAEVFDSKDYCEITVRVRDNGLGVSEPARAHLFEPYYRSASTATQVEGHGLGLSLVKETMESIGGRVWANFEEGFSEFCFALPCRRRSETATAEQVFNRRPTREFSPAHD